MTCEPYGKRRRPMRGSRSASSAPVIQEAIADIDAAAGEIVLLIHWMGEAATDCPSPWYSGVGDRHPRAPRLRGPVAGRDQQHPAARRPLCYRGFAGRGSLQDRRGRFPGSVPAEGLSLVLPSPRHCWRALTAAGEAGYGRRGRRLSCWRGRPRSWRSPRRCAGWPGGSNRRRLVETLRRRRRSERACGSEPGSWRRRRRG
jgi:hypothetical protein